MEGLLERERERRENQACSASDKSNRGEERERWRVYLSVCSLFLCVSKLGGSILGSTMGDRALSSRSSTRTRVMISLNEGLSLG